MHYPKAGILIVLAAGLAMLLPGCSVKKPEAPSWDTTWDLPLTAKNYSIQDIIDKIDDSLIVLDSLGNPGFSINQDVDTITVGDNLTAAGASQHYADSLGTVDIDPPTSQAVSLSKVSLGIPPIGGWVPSGSFNQYQTVPSFDRFSWVRIHQGSMSIQVNNDLGINLDTLILTLYNHGDLTHPLGSTAFNGGILQGQTLTRTINLAGDSLSNQIVMLIHGAVTASFVAGGSDNFQATSSFPTGMTVSAAQAETPSITKDLGQTIELADSSVITQASINSGYFDLNIVNGTQMPATLHLKMPSFTHGTDTLTVNQVLTGGNTLTRHIDLTGYTFRPAGATYPQTISINVSADIPASAPAQRVFTSADSISVTASVSEISFASVSGRVEPTTIAVDSISTDVDVPDGMGNAQLTHASLNLTLYNNSTADVDVNLLMSNESDTRHVGVVGRIAGKIHTSDPPRATVLSIGSDTLSAFLDPTPSRITIAGDAVFNPDNEIVTITQNDFFYGNVSIYSPLAFALSDTIRVKLETSETDVNQDNIPDLEETFGYGNIHAVLANRLPVGARVSLYISTRSDSTIFDDPNALIIGPFTLESAGTDSNGFADTPVTSTFNDSLDSQDITIFNNARVYIAPRVELLPTAAGGSYVQASDYIGITATARIRVHAGNNIWDKNK